MSIYTDLLFMHGHIVDPELARSLVDDDPRKRGERSQSPESPPSPGKAPCKPFRQGSIAAACSIALSPFR